jgi:hypothetical protein
LAAWIILIVYCVVGPLVVLSLVVREMEARRRRARLWKSQLGEPSDRLRAAIDLQVRAVPSRQAEQGVAFSSSGLSQRWRTDSGKRASKWRVGRVLWCGILALVLWTALGYLYVAVMGRLVGWGGAEAWLIVGALAAVMVVATALGALLVWWREKRDA